MVEGTAFNGTLATFTDTSYNQPVSDFSSAINWGDGISRAATISSGPNRFDILGVHAYANPGNFLASVTTLDDGGSGLSFQTDAAGAVPEPGSLGMIVIGLGSIVAIARRRRSTAR